MDGVEARIAQWRAYVAKAPAVDDRDVDELEAHLRDQIAELDAARLTADEAFLVAVGRMGDVDALSREFAREHSGRLWRQLVRPGDDEPVRAPSGGARRSPSPCPQPRRSRSLASPRSSPTSNRPGCCATQVCSCCRSSPGTSLVDAGSA